MNTWRPFAGNLVSHTFEDFRKKHDKIIATNPKNTTPVKEKFDINRLFPYKIEPQDLEKRLEDYENLQRKVNLQRIRIKTKDKQTESKKKALLQLQIQDVKTEKQKKKDKMEKIRSIGVNKSYMNVSVDSEDYSDSTFNLTSLNRGISTSKNRTYTNKSLLPILTPRNKIKL
jgi:hypothetical protein